MDILSREENKTVINCLRQRYREITLAEATRFQIFIVCLETGDDVHFKSGTPIKLLSNVNSDVEMHCHSRRYVTRRIKSVDRLRVRV